MEYTDELESVPSPEHVEQVMNGLIDTVSGNEGFSSSQRYLEAVLHSSGIISYRQVGGTEGILSSIADGAKAAIEYLKKMFRSIWDFFFKKEKKELDIKVEKALEDAKKALDEVDKVKVTTANADAALKKVDAAVNKLKDSPEKTKLKEKVKEAQENKDESRKVEITKAMPGEVFRAHYINPSHNGIANYNINGSVTRLKEIKATAELEVADDIQKIINGLTGYPESVVGITDLASAHKYLDKANACKTVIANSLKGIENEEAQYKRLIEELEAKSKGERNGRANNKEEMTKLKNGLVMITGIITETKKILDNIIHVAKQVDKACVVVI